MMVEISAIIRAGKFDDVRDALHAIGVEFFIFYDVKGVTFTKEHKGSYRGTAIFDASSISRRKIDIVVPEVDAAEVVDCIKKAATTGVAGDGKIFVKDVKTSVRISI
ncbi:MAG: P-II family nitrogen regulator [Cytophaga sp.]|jgi:nitrogen regulatory protein P-II 1|uniref:P-II family nitrogen regulator n=1 Tax=Cytophaga sp. TaxID=29535 RepID=UPI003F7D765C